MTTLPKLTQHGHAPWLHYLRRSFIESGELAAMVDEGIRGAAVDLDVIGQAIANSADYDQVLTQLQADGVPFDDRPDALLIDDVQRAAYTLNPVYEESDRLDGYISLPINPALAHDTTETVAVVRHLLADINCPNVMVEIPATEAGITAIRLLTEDGVCVKATHIYSLAVYERVAQAYWDGLAEYIRTHSIWRRWPTSVAAIAISHMDQKVDALLARHNRPELQGQTGLALARLVYGRFQEIFSGPDWQKMAGRGAHPQRPLWAALTPPDFRYPETWYTNHLFAPDSASRLSPHILSAVRDHGELAHTLSEVEQAQAQMNALASLGIDMEAVAAELQAEALDRMTRSAQNLRESVRRKREQLEDKWQRLDWALGAEETAVTHNLTRLCDNKIMRRIWRHDHTVWQPEPEAIRDRLGWLHLMPAMRVHINQLQTMTADLLAAGFTHALLLGMGGSGLAPHLFADTFSQVALPPRPGLPPRPHLQLEVLANTDPAAILAQAERLDPARTVYVIASKSGRTVETMAAFNYFFNRAAAAVGAENAGDHFIAITDDGSTLADIAVEHHFRHIFYNMPRLASRFAALSFTGLVPAALAGVNLETLLEQAQGMACNAHSCNGPLEGDNVAARLGTALGTLAQNGRNKLTFITSPALAGFADWVEQLLAGSTGKDGVGILPIVGEPVGESQDYGADRLFIHLRLDGDRGQDTAVSALKEAGFPVITLRWHNLRDLGGQFFLWQMAAAVAAHILNVNPFNQPQAEALKAQMWETVARIHAGGEPGLVDTAVIRDTMIELDRFLEEVQPGDAIAIQAFLPPTTEIDHLLQTWRVQLRDHYKLATIVGYGPRCLHTTGQLLKGGPQNIHIIQLVAAATEDAPIPDRAGQPGASLTFGELQALQAKADRQALQRARRRVLHFQLGADVENRLRQVAGQELMLAVG